MSVNPNPVSINLHLEAAYEQIELALMTSTDYELPAFQEEKRELMAVQETLGRILAGQEAIEKRANEEGKA